MLRRNVEPLRVVVAGGGVAGLEALVALRGLAGDAVSTVLVAPEEAFTLRALTVFEPFGLGRPHRYPLADLARDLGAAWCQDTLDSVDRSAHRVQLRSGDTLPYDVLVLAVGAIPYPAFGHGTIFDRAREPAAFDALLDDVRSGRARSVAVVVPDGISWPFPAYELALMLATIESEGAARVTLVTAERDPLEVFGAPAGALVRAELDAAGIDLVCGVRARVPAEGVVSLGSGTPLRADRVVHLPLLTGPRIAGLPYDPDGFIPVDADLCVDDDPDIHAVGDGTTSPVKQGGLAAQQAEAVAEHIAHRAGAGRRPRGYAPVLRALLRTSAGPRYLRTDPPGGEGECLVSDQCLWWPPTKVASHWLTPWLATRDLEAARTPPPRVLPTGGISRGSLSPATMPFGPA